MISGHFFEKRHMIVQHIGNTTATGLAKSWAFVSLCFFIDLDDMN